MFYPQITVVYCLCLLYHIRNFHESESIPFWGYDELRKQLNFCVAKGADIDVSIHCGCCVCMLKLGGVEAHHWSVFTNVSWSSLESLLHVHRHIYWPCHCPRLWHCRLVYHLLLTTYQQSRHGCVECIAEPHYACPRGNEVCWLHSNARALNL